MSDCDDKFNFKLLQARCSVLESKLKSRKVYNINLIP
jgi:hypothetical protein